MNTVSNRNTVALLIFSTGSFILSYATTIIFARAMGADGYDDYAVAISSMAILATLAEMGTGKYALRILPVYNEGQNWSGAKAYLRFSIILIFIVSIILIFFTAGMELLEDGELGNYALGIAILFLPIIAWVGAGSEVVMANLAVIRSAFVTRLLVPGATLILGLLWVMSPYDLTPIRGVLIYGIGWITGFIVVILFIRKITRPEIWQVKPAYRVKEWTKSIMPFLFFALLISTLAKVGVIILEIVSPNEVEVAVYAVAAETGAFIYLIAKSTDKMFLPDVSLLIERKDIDGIRKGRKRRWLWLSMVCALFLLVIFIFGKNILSVFGPEFVTGYPALCIIAISTSVWTMASLAPSYLKYIGKNRMVLIATSVTVLSHIGLCFPLGYYYGATGAAISYAVPIIILYAMFGIMAGYYHRKTISLNINEKA